MKSKHPHLTTRTVRLVCGDCTSRFPGRAPGFLGDVVWNDLGPEWGDLADSLPFRCAIRVARRRGKRWSESQQAWMDAQAAQGAPVHTDPFGPRTDARVVEVEHGANAQVNSQPWWIKLSCPSCPKVHEGPIGILVAAADRLHRTGEETMIVGAPVRRSRAA